MKALFKVHNQCTNKYSKHPNGWEFIDTVADESEAWGKVANLEDADWFPQDNGTVLTASGSEAFDPAHPDRFLFGDYHYRVDSIDGFDEYEDSHKIEAIHLAVPLDANDILQCSAVNVQMTNAELLRLSDGSIDDYPCDLDGSNSHREEIHEVDGCLYALRFTWAGDLVDGDLIATKIEQS